MSTVVTASAPGKLVLTGEYAVLENAPAVSAATDLRATVEIRPINTKYSELHVVNTGGRYGFQLDSADASMWVDDPGEYGAIVDAAFNVMHKHGSIFDQSQAIAISICTRDFYQLSDQDIPQKKGIGSSAAVAVALTAALQTFVGAEPDMGLALQVHHRFQGAQGSGIDVATSWFGGVIAMLPGQPPTSMPKVQELAWPDGLHVMPVWTGVAASTVSKLRLLDEYKSGSQQDRAEVFELVCQAATVAKAAWEKGSAPEILEAISRFSESLRQLDAAASLGIWSESHQKLYSFADQSDVVYKPSGAGGGDFGIAFATDEAKLSSFGRQAVEQGFGVNTVAWSSEGLCISQH